MQQLLPCPQVGHASFENSLKQILIGDVETPTQITKFVRPASCVTDDGLGIQYAEGQLQKQDLSLIPQLFAYPRFVLDTYHQHRDRFRVSECRIYQFQTIPRSGTPFIFGLFITDGNHNLIDFCVESTQSAKRRQVLIRLMRAICTPASVTLKITH